MANADVVSSDIVGYQQVPVASGYSLFTATFKDVGDGDIDLCNITPVTAEGGSITAKGTIYAYKLDSTGAYGTAYRYYTNKSPVGWYSGNTALTTGTVTFNAGEGIAVRNATGATIAFQVSGAVDLVCQNAIPTGYSVTGNSTPVSIDLTNITPLTAEGGAITAKGTIYLYQLDSAGSYGTAYRYYTNKTPVGWYVGNTAVSAGDVTLAAGDAVAVRNATGSSILFQLPSPVTK